MRMRVVRLVCSIAVTSVCAHATTLLRMSLAKLTQTAKAIVRARCVGNSTAWDAGEIWTFTAFETEEVWRGSPPAEVTVRLLGGRLGNITSSVSGVPRFRAGEDVVLFLEPTRRGDFSVVGWEEGTFRVRRDVRTTELLVTQDTAALATFDPRTRQFQAEGIIQMPLSAFRARVAQLAGSGAVGTR